MLGLLNINRTVRRMRHVQKVYGHVPGVVGATMAILNGSLITAVYRDPSSTDALFVPNIDQLYDLGPSVNPYIPWIAREVRKGFKAYDRHGEAPPGLDIRAWPRQWGGVKDWLVATGADTGPLSFPEAHQRSHEWHERLKLDRREGMEVEQGLVIDRLSNGWTAQELVSRQQLEDEGTAMGHCVGDYWDRVQQGYIAILSLRDARGRPHVTVELDPSGGRVYSPLHAGVYELAQIQGKENKRPVDKYHPYIIEALDPLLSDEAKSTWEYEQYKPGGRDRFWQEATQDEGILEEYVAAYEDEEEGLDKLLEIVTENADWGYGSQQLSASVFKSTSLSVSLDKASLVLSIDLNIDRIREIEDTAQDSYTAYVYSSGMSQRPGFDDDLMWEAWHAGSSKAWKAFREAIGDEAEEYTQETGVASWRLFMHPRSGFLGLFVEGESDGRWSRSMCQAESDILDATRNIQSAFESWANDQTTESISKLDDLLDEREP